MRSLLRLGCYQRTQLTLIGRLMFRSLPCSAGSCDRAEERGRVLAAWFHVVKVSQRNDRMNGCWGDGTSLLWVRVTGWSSPSCELKHLSGRRAVAPPPSSLEGKTQAPPILKRHGIIGFLSLTQAKYIWCPLHKSITIYYYSKLNTLCCCVRHNTICAERIFQRVRCWPIIQMSPNVYTIY